MRVLKTWLYSMKMWLLKGVGWLWRGTTKGKVCLGRRWRHMYTPSNVSVLMLSPVRECPRNSLCFNRCCCSLLFIAVIFHNSQVVEVTQVSADRIKNAWWACSAVSLCDPIDCSPQTPRSMGFAQQEHCNRLPSPSRVPFPPRMEPVSPTPLMHCISFIV